jgi:hypothetical protein
MPEVPTETPSPDHGELLVVDDEPFLRDAVAASLRVIVNGSGGGQTVEDNDYVWWNQIHNDNHWIGIRARSRSARP